MRIYLNNFPFTFQFFFFLSVTKTNDLFSFPWFQPSLVPAQENMHMYNKVHESNTIISIDTYC